MRTDYARLIFSEGDQLFILYGDVELTITAAGEHIVIESNGEDFTITPTETSIDVT